MSDYQLLDGTSTVKRLADNAFIPAVPGNVDRRVYEAWLAEGNTPDPAEPLPIIPPMRDANQRLDAGISAAQPSLDEATQASERTARTTEDQLAALQLQVNALQTAMENMLHAQLGTTPR